MKQTLAVSLLALALVASACATSVDVAYVGNSPNNFMGTAAFPAYLVLSGGIGSINAVNDTYGGTAHIGSTWTATLIDLTGGNIAGTYFAGLGVQAYEEAGYIYKNFLFSDPVNANWAIWDAFGASLPPDTQGVTLFILAEENASLSDLDGLYAITPTFGGGQEFLGENYTATPEPASMMLLGSGVLGLAAWMRKRRMA